MTTRAFQAERIDVTTKRSFAETVASFENEVPTADVASLAGLVSARAGIAYIERSVQAMVGDLGVVVLAKLEQGPLTSLLGKPKKMITYLIGNPLLANRMYEQEPAVCAYAPLRASIYQDYRGTTHFTYERPSASLAQFGGGEVRAVARMLDDKMNALARHLA